MPIYTTGRRRTITVTGTFSGSTAYEFDPNTLAGFQRNVLLSVTLFTTVGLPGAWPTVMGFEVNSAGLGTFGSGWNYQGENIEWNASTGFGITSSSGSHPFGTPGFPLVPVADSLNLGGSFTASIEVEECVEVEPLTGSDVDVYGWPQYGDAGNAQRHNRAPFAQSARYFERIYNGATVSFSFNAGPISWSGSGTYSGIPQEIAREHLCVVGTEGQASGMALPGGTTTMTVLENGEPLGYTESHSYTSGSISNSGNTNAGASVSMSGDTGGIFRNNYAVVEGWHRPPTKYKVELTAWRYDERVNFDTTWRVVEDSTGTKTVTVPLGDAERDVDQRRSQWIFNLGPTLAAPDPAAQKSGTYSNLSPLRAWLADSWLNTAGEDRWNWRALARGRLWPALDLSHAVSTSLFSGASLTGWSGSVVAGTGAVRLTGAATRTFTPKANLEGYRYLRLSLRSVGGAGVTSTLSIGAKQWGIAGGAAGDTVEVDLDLCSPNNRTDTSDDQWTRFPVTFGTDEPITESDAWGVGRVSSFVFGAPAGGDLEILSASLVRKSAPKATVRPWMWSDRELLLRWDSPTDMTYGWPNVIVWNDGRVNDLHDQAFVMPDSLVGEYYALYTLNDLRDFWASLSGWSGTSLTGPDSYHTGSAPGVYLHGGGYLRTYSGGQWQMGSDISTGTIHAQALWDEVQLYPGAGEVWTAGAYLVRSRIGWAWNCRGRAEGLVHDLDDRALAGVRVTTAPSSGEGTSQTLGDYRTGLPFFQADTPTDVECLGESVPGATVYLGASQRFCFRVAKAISNSVSTDAHQDGRLWRATIVSGDAVVEMRDRAGVWRTFTTTVPCTGVALRTQKVGQTPRLYLLTVEASGLLERVSTSNGETFGMPTTLSSTGNPRYPALDIERDGASYTYWVAGTTAPYTVQYLLRDRAGNTLRSGTALSGVDDAPIAVRYVPAAPGGAAKVFLQVFVGGALTEYVSTDGAVFV